MATANATIERWIAGNEKKAVLYKTTQSLILSWLNEAQQSYAEQAEVLQEIWTPTITSSGSIALPADFVREVKDRVKWTTDITLKQIDYPTANLATFSDTEYYSIWENTFFVWTPAAGTPSIPYLKSPTVITVANLATADLELPKECHNDLLVYLDAMWARKHDDTVGSMVLLKKFEEAASHGKYLFSMRRKPISRTQSNWF